MIRSTTENIELARQCVELRRSGKSYREIGAALNIGHVIAFRHVQAWVEDIEAHTREGAKAIRELELTRLDKAMAVVDETLEHGDDETKLKAVAALCRIQERRAKLLGLDAPTQVTVRQDPVDAMPIDEVWERIRAMDPARAQGGGSN